MKLPLSVSFNSAESPSSIRADCVAIWLTIHNESKSNDRLFIFNGGYILRGNTKILALDEGFTAGVIQDTLRTESCIVLACKHLHFPISTLISLEIGDRIISHIKDFFTDDGIRTELICTSTEPVLFDKRSQRRDVCATGLVDFDKDYRVMDIESGLAVEITDIVERLELIEEKLGVRFEGVCARARKRIENTNPDYIVEINFDVIGSEAELKQSLQPTLTAYNDMNQVIATDDTFINNDKFIGLQSCRIVIECHQKPRRLRLYPKIF